MKANFKFFLINISYTYYNSYKISLGILIKGHKYYFPHLYFTLLAFIHISVLLIHLLNFIPYIYIEIDQLMNKTIGIRLNVNNQIRPIASILNSTYCFHFKFDLLHTY